jgi:hypothetical protein
LRNADLHGRSDTVKHVEFHQSGDDKGLTALLPFFQRLFPGDKGLQEFAP